MRALTLLLAATVAAPLDAAQCEARSGPYTAALVELYTSEGCNSCPPADRWLRGLGEKGSAPGRVVPLALHVDYWDYIGWKDPFAQKRFSDRQRRLAGVHHSRVVYTPQVMLQGRDFRGWRSGDFAREVAAVNARPPKAAIELRLDTGRADTLGMEVRAELLEAARAADAVLYLARYQSGLASSVAAGENRGRHLEHDFVVLDWVGPIPLSQGRLAEARTFRLPPGANQARAGVAAFVQNRRTAEVLQALMLPACAG
jgi:hypothetical protein